MTEPEVRELPSWVDVPTRFVATMSRTVVGHAMATATAPISMMLTPMYPEEDLVEREATIAELTMEIATLKAEISELKGSARVATTVGRL